MQAKQVIYTHLWVGRFGWQEVAQVCIDCCAKDDTPELLKRGDTTLTHPDLVKLQ